MKKLFQSKGGHSIWRDAYGMVIKDRSGSTPDATDDGILYIDRTRKPVARNDGSVWLPLKKPNGEQVSTVTSPEVYRWLRKRLWRNEYAVQALDCPYCGDAS